MCTSNQQIKLVETDFTHVSWCERCQSISLVHKCFCTSFTQNELQPFLDLVESLEEKDFHYQMMNDSYAIFKTQQSSVGICLTRSDADETVRSLSEATPILHAHQIVNSQ